VNPRAGLEDMEKLESLNLPELEIRPLGRSARSQSLYRTTIPRLMSLIICIGIFLEAFSLIQSAYVILKSHS
jgi:hypothetical protein